MTLWKDAVEFCKAHYNKCYTCPLRSACFEKRLDKTKSRTAAQFEKDMIKALEDYKNNEKLFLESSTFNGCLK